MSRHDDTGRRHGGHGQGHQQPRRDQDARGHDGGSRTSAGSNYGDWHPQHDGGYNDTIDGDWREHSMADQGYGSRSGYRGPSQGGHQGEHDGTGHRMQAGQRGPGSGYGGYDRGYDRGHQGAYENGHGHGRGYGGGPGGSYGRGPGDWPDSEARGQGAYGDTRHAGHEDSVMSRGGYGARPSGADSEFDPDYHQWRSEQMRKLDDDYRSWRQERYKTFSDEFSQWRNSRDRASGSAASSADKDTAGNGSTGSTAGGATGKSNK